MKLGFNFLPALAVFFSISPCAQEATLPEIEVKASKIPESTDAALGATTLTILDLAPKRASTSDTAQLLEDVPGVSLFGAGGISSLPVIHGMADERLNIEVNGMGLLSACPNHMNSPLSYIDPTSVDSIKVYAGVVPVSVGGDSIGGTIQVNSAAPKFAKPDEAYIASGLIGGFYRSNGYAHGSNIQATGATRNFNISYTASQAESENYRAAHDFHKAGSGSMGGRWLDGDVVGSSAFRSSNQEIGIAGRLDNHLLQLSVSEQKVPYEGFPNQRMDLTNNKSTIINLAYTGQFEWGDLKVRVYQQDVRHEMNMGPDRMFGEFPGMPMLTKSKLQGAKLQANVLYSERDTFRLGVEAQEYTLYDWWPPIGGQMGPNDFWNIDYGTRNKMGAFAEWEARWNQRWTSLLGLRGDFVETNAGPVQGYNGLPIWAYDAGNFNARDRKREFSNLDLTALVRYEPNAKQAFDLGYARKARAPSLYQLYPWSTYEMATTMNNFSGDGGGYVGNVDLKEEIAHTVSASGDFHDALQETWNLKVTGYFTHIENYISARRCDFSYCDPNKLTATTGFVLLQHSNETAQIYGLDISGRMKLIDASDFGSLSGSFLFNYLRGKETSTGDNLFNMMPPNLKLSLTQRWGIWTNTAEVQMVAEKKDVSQVRNEVGAPSYELLNLRSSLQFTPSIRADLAIENVFNRFYQHPLGGAYVGQGNAMFLNSMQWGNYVPGKGRSLNIALNLRF